MPDICGHANCDKEAHAFTQVGRLIIMLCPEHADIRHEDWRAQRAQEVNFKGLFDRLYQNQLPDEQTED